MRIRDCNTADFVNYSFCQIFLIYVQFVDLSKYLGFRSYNVVWAMQRSDILCCIVLKCVVYAKKEPFGAPFLRERWDSKGWPERSEGAKQSGGLFCRPWESPSDLRRIPEGCGSNWNLYEAQKRWNAALFQKVQKEYSHQKGALWGSFFAREMGPERAAAALAAVKTVRWTVFSPWESLSDLRRIPEGCGSIRNMSDAGKDWYGILLQNVLIGLTQQIVIYCTGAAAPLALPMGELSAQQAD